MTDPRVPVTKRERAALAGLLAEWDELERLRAVEAELRAAHELDQRSLHAAMEQNAEYVLQLEAWREAMPACQVVGCKNKATTGTVSHEPELYDEHVVGTNRRRECDWAPLLRSATSAKGGK
jgi:hypothetical protein